MKYTLLFLSLIVLSVAANSDIFLGEDHHPGFVQVKDKDNLFYWLFKSRSDPKNDPLVIWLTGGPGCSSELAIFFEQGPFKINDDVTLRINPWSWNNASNLLFVDQPVGTGYSHGEKKDFVHNETEVSEDFHQFLVGFLEKFPEFKGRPLFVTGESYAGHYVPAISAHLKSRNDSNINLIGSAIGNGWVNPYLQYPAYADYALENKLVGKVKYYFLKNGLFKACQTLIKNGNWDLAMQVCNVGVSSIQGNPPKFNTYDIRIPCKIPGLCYNFSLVNDFLAREDVQTILGVKGQKWESCNMEVHQALMGDWMVSLSEKVHYLLDHGVRVLVYSGDKDYICNWRGGEAWVNGLEWCHQKDFVNAPYQEWMIDGKSYGQFKSSNYFTFLRVYEAGHMVPMDQPEASFNMLTRFFKKWMPKVQKEITEEDIEF